MEQKEVKEKLLYLYEQDPNLLIGVSFTTADYNTVYTIKGFNDSDKTYTITWGDDYWKSSDVDMESIKSLILTSKSNFSYDYLDELLSFDDLISESDDLDWLFSDDDHDLKQVLTNNPFIIFFEPSFETQEEVLKFLYSLGFKFKVAGRNFVPKEEVCYFTCDTMENLNQKIITYSQLYDNENAIETVYRDEPYILEAFDEQFNENYKFVFYNWDTKDIEFVNYDR